MLFSEGHRIKNYSFKRISVAIIGMTYLLILASNFSKPGPSESLIVDSFTNESI
jgi:hypothetical protein